MKKSPLSVIMLFIAWAVSAVAISTPMPAIMQLEDTLCNRYSDENICYRTGVRRTLIHLIAGDTGVYGGVSGTNEPQNVSVRTRIPGAWNRRTAARHISPHPDLAHLRIASVYQATRLIDVFQTPSVHYPYGEPTIEPTGQRYLFAGKKREHAGGCNSYDYGPRNLGPSGNWDSPDKLATETPQISPLLLLRRRPD